jgi:hypothetical protein
VTSKGHAEYTVFTVIKYDEYQSTDKTKDKPKTSERQTKDKRATTVIEEKELIDELEVVEETKDKISLAPFSDEFVLDWDKWIDYRKNELKKTFKELSTEQTAFNQLVKKSKRNQQTAREIIDQSIGNQWTGLFELKTNQNGKSKPTYEEAIGRLVSHETNAGISKDSES